MGRKCLRFDEELAEQYNMEHLEQVHSVLLGKLGALGTRMLELHRQRSAPNAGIDEPD